MSRTGRGWGPFSGAQLTTMVCVIVAAVAFPVAASAVTGSNVFVTDATSGKTAKVTSGGAVTVSGTVTSKLQGATSANKVEITKDQQLLTAEASPDASVTPSAYATAGDDEALLTLIPGSGLIVKSIAVSAIGATGTDPYIDVYLSTSNACADSISRFVGEVDFPAGNSTTVLPFAAGVPVPDGIQLCAQVENTNVAVSMDGYLVPAAAINTPIKKVGSLRKRP